MNITLLKSLDSRQTTSPLSNKNVAAPHLIKTILFVFLLSSILIGESTLPTPCRSHGGPARLDEGSGLCTGNYESLIPLNTIGFSLHHNSSNATASGPFGKGFSLSVEAGFYKTSATVGKKVTGEGLEIVFQKASNSELWYPQNSLESNHWLEFTPTELIERSPEGLQITYSPLSSDPLSFAIKGIRHISGRGLGFQRSNNKITQITSDNGQRIVINYLVNPASGRPNVEIKDFLSNTYGLFIDSANHLTRVIFPDARQQVFSYRGDLISSILYPNGERQSIEYDASGSVSRIIHPDGLATVITYTNTTVASNHPRIEFLESFDAEKRLIASSVNGQRTTLERDLQGRVIRTTNPLGLVTGFTDYGPHQLPGSITRSDGTVENYTYDSNGNVTNLSTKINGILTQSVDYNSLSLATKVTSRGQITDYTYDAKGYLTQVQSSLLGILYIATYDADGNLKTVVDKNGLLTSYTYNTKNQLTQVNYPTGKIQTFSPDAFERPTAIGGTPNLTQSARYSDTGGTTTATSTLAAGSALPISEIRGYTPRIDGGGVSTTQQFVGTSNILTETIEYDKRGRVIRSTRQ